MACNWGSNDNLSRKLTTKLSCFGANIFLAKRTAEVLVKIGITVPVTIQKGCFSRALRCCAGFAKQQNSKAFYLLGVKGHNAALTI